MVESLYLLVYGHIMPGKFLSLIFRFKEAFAAIYNMDLIEKNLFKLLHKAITRNKYIKLSEKVLSSIRNVSIL